MENQFKDCLKVGQVFKNYKELCLYLGEDIKDGNSKKSQLRNWDCYFKTHKEGNKIIIDEIYDTPKQNEYQRGGANNVIFGDIIELLILDLLTKENDNVLVIGRTKLMNMIGMTNVNYKIGKNIMYKLSDYICSDVKVVQDFYRTNDSNFKSAIESSLKRLKNKRLIDYSTVTKIKEQNSNKFRLATEDELLSILVVEKRVLTTLDYRTMDEVRRSSDWNVFKNKCKELIQAITDIDYYFSAYKIIVDTAFAENEKINIITSILDKANIDKSKSELNILIMDNINKNAIKRHENADNSKLEEFKDTRKDKDYVRDINNLSKLLISLKMKINIIDLLKVKDDNSYEKESVESYKLNEDMIEYIEDMLDIL